MKKTYQAPCTFIAEIELQQMMVSGSNNNYGRPEQGQDLDAVGETSETSGNLSRRRSVWDEEEEDDLNY